MLRVGTTWIDTDAGTVHARGRIQALTSTERDLLRFLASTAPDPQPRKRLLEEVWGYDPTVKTHTVKTTVSRLRSKLGDDGERLVTLRGKGYALRVDPSVDAPCGRVALVCLVAPWEGHLSDQGPREHQLDALLAAVCEEDGFPWLDEPGRHGVAFADREQARAWAASMQRAARAQDPPVDLAMSIVVTEAAQPPEYHGPHRRQALALAHAAQWGEILVEEEVGPDPMALTPEPAPARTPARALPMWHTPWVGRAEDVERLCELVDSGRRLVVLAGPGGVGKTRLACVVASRLGEALMVDVSSPATEVVAATAHALGLSAPLPRPTRIERVGMALDERSIRVLILDGAESAASDLASVVAAWTRRAPALAVLVTSRVRNALPGAWFHDVKPLHEDDAVALFQSLGAAARGRDLERDDTVMRLIHALDRLPLAIELATARLGLLDPAQLLSSLERRFAILTGTDGAGSERDLRATIAWSWDQLSAEARSLLSQLCLFEGPFTMEAAQAVTDAPSLVPALDGLRRHSLLQTGQRSLSLLHSIREFVRDERAPGDEATLRYARWVVEHGHHLEGEADRGRQASREAHAHLREVLAAAARVAPIDPGLAVDALFLVSSRHAEVPAFRDTATAVRAALEARDDVAESLRLRARALEGLGWTLADAPRAATMLRTTATEASERGDRVAEAHALRALAGAGAALSPAERIDCLDRAADLFESTGATRDAAFTLLWLARLLANGDRAHARETFLRAERLQKTQRSRLLQTVVALDRAALRTLSADHAGAEADARLAAELAHAASRDGLEARAWLTLAILAIGRGDPASATEPLRRAEKLSRRASGVIGPALRMWRARYLLQSGELDGADQELARLGEMSMLPEMHCERVLCQGMVAEERGELTVAAARYRWVVDNGHDERGQRAAILNACHHLGAVLARSGHRAEARETLQQAEAVGVRVNRPEVGVHHALSWARWLATGSEEDRDLARAIYTGFRAAPERHQLGWSLWIKARWLARELENVP